MRAIGAYRCKPEYSLDAVHSVGIKHKENGKQGRGQADLRRATVASKHINNGHGRSRPCGSACDGAKSYEVLQRLCGSVWASYGTSRSAPWFYNFNLVPEQYSLAGSFFPRECLSQQRVCFCLNEASALPDHQTSETVLCN